MSTAPERASPPSSALHTCSAPSRDQPWNWIDSTFSLLRCNLKLNYIKSSFAYLLCWRPTYDKLTNSDFLLLILPFYNIFINCTTHPTVNITDWEECLRQNIMKGLPRKFLPSFPDHDKEQFHLYCSPILSSGHFESGFPYLIADLLVRVHVISSIRFILGKSFVRSLYTRES